MGDVKFNFIEADLEPVGEVAITLLDKFDKAMGWVATPKGKRKEMQEAIDCYIEEIKGNDKLNTLTKAALISEARKTIKEYCNLKDIVHLAIEQLNEESKPENVDEDWLSYFSEHAKLISREDVKILWGKVLATECNESGSISKQLINTLLLIGKQEAELFNKLCQFSVERIKGELGNEKTLLIFFDDVMDFVKKNKLNTKTNYELEALGLINVIPSGIGIEEDNEHSVFGCIYHDALIEISSASNYFPLGNVAFTRNGEILAELINVEKNGSFLNYIKQNYESMGCTVTISQIK